MRLALEFPGNVAEESLNPTAMSACGASCPSVGLEGQTTFVPPLGQSA